MWKKIFAASAVAVGIVGILGSGSAFADLPEINSGSYAPGQTIYAVATNSKICINKNGGYDGDLIIADIWGTNFRKQITFDSFSGDESCKLVGGAPSDGRMRFVTPMGLSNMSFFTQVEDGYVDGEIYLSLNNATTSNKYVRSYGNTTTRTAKSVATITLDANGGTGALPVIAGATIGSSVTLPKSTLVRDGYRFAGWNTKADGTGTPYADEATITVEEPGQIQLFAQWVVATTTLDTGRKVNAAIKTLAAGSSVRYDNNDTLIKKLEFVDTLPAAVNDDTPKVNIALSGEEPVYAYWVANEGEIYINTEADIIYANSDSSIMFRRMQALTSLTLPASFDTSNVTDMHYMFDDMQALTSLTLPTSFDTSNVTNMRSMFSNMRALTSLTLSTSFNTANVTDMSNMFYHTQALTSLTLPTSFNTANVTDMSFMFYEMRALTSLTLPTSFDTAKVTKMTGMFSYMTALTSLTLPTSFNTANVTVMSDMFSHMPALTSLTLPTSFDTAKVTDMRSMFRGMTALTSLTLPTSFNTANVTNMTYMFAGMPALTSLNLPTSFDTANVTNMSEMFDGASALIAMMLPDSFVISSGTNAADMFNGISNTAILCATDPTARSLWPGIYCGTTKLQSGQNVNAAIKQLAGDGGARFSDENTSIKTIKFVDELPSGINPNTAAKVNIGLDGLMPVYAYWNGDGNVYIDSEAETIYANENSSSMFQNFTRLTAIDFSDIFNTSKTTNMWLFFFGDAALTSLTLPSSFDTSKVTTMQQMFQNVSSLTTLNLPTSFNTSNVRNMNFMFAGMSRLTTLTFSNSFNTKNVENMAQMFQGMTSLTALNLPESFNTSKVTTMQQMFLRCEALTSLTLPAAFDTSKVSDMQQMFLLTSSLTKLTLPDAFVVKSGANTNGIFATTSSTAVLYATDSTIRSLWPGVLGN